MMIIASTLAVVALIGGLFCAMLAVANAILYMENADWKYLRPVAHYGLLAIAFFMIFGNVVVFIVTQLIVS